MANPTLEQVRENPYLLDSPDFAVPKDVRVIMHEKLAEVPAGLPILHVPPNYGVRLFRRVRLLYHFFYAWQLLLACDKNSVLLVNGSSGLLWLFIGYLNKFFRRKRTLQLWDLFVEYRLGTEKRLKFLPFIKVKTQWKEAVASGALKEYGLNILFSRKQIKPHAEVFHLPEEKFIFLPYKANHSQRENFDLPMSNFIFAGGNGKRDFKTLMEAVRGTNIPVIISTTDPNIRKQIGLIQRGLPYNDKIGKGGGGGNAIFDDSISNVIVLAAAEPAFGQLQAMSRFCVVPMTYSGLKGGGEANFCNAMYHGKAVIAACSIAAEEYIVDGETGYVVPSGDVEGLRKRIIELWNAPEKCREMGRKGHERVEEYFTHAKVIQRELRLAFVLGESKQH